MMSAEGGKGSALGAGVSTSATSDLVASESGAVAGFDDEVEAGAEAEGGVRAGTGGKPRSSAATAEIESKTNSMAHAITNFTGDASPFAGFIVYPAQA